MDLSKLIKNATAKKVEPVVMPEEPILALCMCGHPQDAHEQGSDDCMILECECTSYYPSHHVPTDENIATEAAKEIVQPVNELPILTDNADLDEVIAQVIEEAPKRGLSITFKVPANTKIADSCNPIVQVSVPQTEDWDNDMSKCHHLCSTESCGKWWTHGPVEKCRYPDLVNQGKCPTCLGGGVNPDPTEDFVDGKITVATEIKIRNRERVICKDMNVEQLTRHIEFYAREIEALRIKSFETRKMRDEAEEAELADVSEADRQKFINALRNGAAKEKKPRKPRTPKTESGEPGVRLSAYEKNVQNLMKTMGKTRQQIEAFLED